MDGSDIGSLAVPNPNYREQMEISEAAGVLLALRRGSANLFYPGVDRNYWVPTRHIATIPIEAVPEDCLEHFLSRILKFLRTEECTLLEFDGTSATLEITYPGVDREGFLSFLAFLGPRLENYVIEPGSMQVAQLQLQLNQLPPPAPTV